MSEKSIESKLLELKKTIDFKWRVQSMYPKTNPTNAIMIPYVDARDVQQRLDDVIGSSGWQSDFKDIGGRLFGGIGIIINNEWIWKWDRGVASQTEKEKGEASDCFKRAAVLWGINRDAYLVGTVKLKVKEYGGKSYPCDDNGKFLKSQELYAHCNRLAKITDLDNYDIEITEGYLSEGLSNELTPYHPRWSEAVKSLKNNDTTLAEIEKHFTLSEANKQLLIDEAI